MKINIEKIDTITGCFEVVLGGDKEESRLAARRVRFLLYKQDVDFKEIKDLVRESPERYGQIDEDWRQENFVVAVSVLYYLRDNRNDYDIYLPWFLWLLQHKNGNIRHATVRMLTDAIIYLTRHLRISNYKSLEFDSKEADRTLDSLHFNLRCLLDILHESRFEKYEYIESLPSSPYKSVQQVLSKMEDCCYTG